MAIFLNNEDVAQLLTMSDTIEAVEIGNRVRLAR